MSSFVKKMCVGFLIAGSAILTGCPDTKNRDNVNYPCDAYGNCGYNRNGYNYNGGYNANPNQVILSGGLQVLQPALWRRFMDGLIDCRQGWFTTCRWVDSAPRISITIDDYKLPSNVSSGSINIGNLQVYPSGFNVRWRLIDNSTAFDTMFLLPYDRRNNPIRIKLNGRTTDDFIYTELYMSGTLIAQGTIARMTY